MLEPKRLKEAQPSEIAMQTLIKASHLISEAKRLILDLDDTSGSMHDLIYDDVYKIEQLTNDTSHHLALIASCYFEDLHFYHYEAGKCAHID